jgi:hypothetical protein
VIKFTSYLPTVGGSLRVLRRVIQAYNMYFIIVDLRSVYGIVEMDVGLYKITVSSTHHDVTDKFLN